MPGSTWSRPRPSRSTAARTWGSRGGPRGAGTNPRGRANTTRGTTHDRVCDETGDPDDDAGDGLAVLDRLDEIDRLDEPVGAEGEALPIAEEGEALPIAEEGEA